MSEPGAGSGAEAIVHDYFARLERALAPLPKDRRQQILDDLRDHVTTALAEGTPASQVLAALGTPEDIANEAYASGPTRPAKRAWRPRRLQLRYTVALAALVVALAGGTVGFVVTSDTAAQHPAKSASELTAHVADANSTCSPTWVASASGGPASVLTSTATEVASGTTGGQAWTLWSAKRETGALRMRTVTWGCRTGGVPGCRSGPRDGCRRPGPRWARRRWARRPVPERG